MLVSDSHGQSWASSGSTSEVTGQSAIQKFKAIINATPTVMGLSKDAEWKMQFYDGAAWIPNIVEFIHIFLAKTQFYEVWKPAFPRAQEYPDM